jgi:hypothetical protein
MGGKPEKSRRELRVIMNDFSLSVTQGGLKPGHLFAPDVGNGLLGFHGHMSLRSNK